VGHEGIAGNEAADKEAKKAAQGHSSDKPLLPLYLRKQMLINSSAIKRAHHDMIKGKWVSKWKDSERGKKARSLDPSSPSKKFLNAISHPELSRDAASRVAQFRLNHAPVNQYLKRIGKADYARCPACGADVETIEHLLLICPNYAYKRWALAQQANKLNKSLSMKTLLGTPELIIPLAKFIDASGWFKQNLATLSQTNNL